MLECTRAASTRGVTRESSRLECQALDAQPQRHLHGQVAAARAKERRDNRAVGAQATLAHLRPELQGAARARAATRSCVAFATDSTAWWRLPGASGTIAV